MKDLYYREGEELTCINSGMSDEGLVRACIKLGIVKQQHYHIYLQKFSKKGYRLSLLRIGYKAHAMVYREHHNFTQHHIKLKYELESKLYKKDMSNEVYKKLFNKAILKYYKEHFGNRFGLFENLNSGDGDINIYDNLNKRWIYLRNSDDSDFVRGDTPLTDFKRIK